MLGNSLPFGAVDCRHDARCGGRTHTDEVPGEGILEGRKVGSPWEYISFPMAVRMRSVALYSRYGPVWPKFEMEASTSPGLILIKVS